MPDSNGYPPISSNIFSHFHKDCDIFSHFKPFPEISSHHQPFPVPANSYAQTAAQQQSNGSYEAIFQQFPAIHSWRFPVVICDRYLAVILFHVL